MIHGINLPIFVSVSQMVHGQNVNPGSYDNTGVSELAQCITGNFQTKLKNNKLQQNKSPNVYMIFKPLTQFPPSAAYMRQLIGPALAQIMACRLFGDKPLSKPMLGYCLF